MPSKYSHGLVLSQQQYWGIINIHAPQSSSNSTSYTRSIGSSIHSASHNVTQSSAYSKYLRLEPDPEPEPSYNYGTSTYTPHPSVKSAPSQAPRFESTSSEWSRPPSDRLRLESPFGFRIENLNPPSPPPDLEPTLPERPHYDPPPSHRLPNSESLPSERLRLESPFPLRPRNSRPSLHHKSSSVETQIYAPERTTSPPPSREDNLYPAETREHYPSFRHGTPPAHIQEPQDVFSMESPESAPPPISREDRQGGSSLETWRAHLPSPTRDRRQHFIQETQALASPPLENGWQAHSPFGTQDSPLFPSAQELQDYFSLATQGSRSTPAVTEVRQDISSVNARSALPTPPQDGQVRASLNIQRLQSPLQTKDQQRRPSFGTQHLSSQRRPQTAQESVHGRRQSINSQTMRDLRDKPSLGPQRLSLEESVEETQQSRRQLIDTNPKLSLEQFIQESERIREPSIDSKIYPPQSSSSYTGEPNSRQTTLANAQRYTPKSSSLEHSPRSRRDRPLKLPDTFASHHRILLPTSQGAHDNVLIETHGFPPERPPSPPATPDLSKSCSLTPQAEEPQKTRPTPPIPQRSARRSPPRQRSILRSTNSSVHLPSEPPRPKTSSAIDLPTNSRKAAALHFPTLSISTRRSSLNATISPQSVSFTNFSETMTSPRRVSFSQSRDREYFDDADLESLPSEIDYNVIPYEDPNVGPAIFRTNQLGVENPVSPRHEDPKAAPALFHTESGLGKSLTNDRPALSRASSFDSAAPPPIGLNRRISHAVAVPCQSRIPKRDSKMSLLSFLRSTPAPKAILYSEATQGKAPVPVAVSRTSAPSIPLLFPGYRGQFPPPHKLQDKGSRSKPLDARTNAPRSKAHADAAEKRKSWFKGDDVDKGHVAMRPSNTWELERILSNL